MRIGRIRDRYSFFLTEVGVEDALNVRWMKLS